MADNSTLPATGDVIATDDIGGVKWQRVKVAFGADGSATEASATTPLPASVPEQVATGSLGATGSVTLTPVGVSTAVAQVTGTWAGTLAFEASVDGTNFFAINGTPPTTGIPVTTTTANGAWLLPCGGFKQLRVRCSAFTSGTIVITIQGSNGVQLVQTTGTVTEQGTDAHDAVLTAAPVVIGGYAKAAAPTDVSADGDAVQAWFLRNGAQCVNLTAAGTLIASGNGTAATAIRVTVASDSTGTTACTSATAANFNVRADHTLVDNAAFVDGTTRVAVVGYVFDAVAGTALTENDIAAARIDSKRAVVNAIEDGTTRNQFLAVSSAGAAKVEGGAAHGASVAGAPMLAGVEARTSTGTAVTSGQAARAMGDVFGKQVVLIGGLHEERVSGYANYTGTTASDLIAAPGAGIKIAVTNITIVNGGSVTTKVTIRSKTTTSNKFGPITMVASGGGFAQSAASTPLFIATANEAIEAICATTGADVDVIISGYLIKN